MQEEMLAFAECMREHGIDMPDPVFSEDGRVEAQSGDISDIGSDAFEEASRSVWRGQFRAVRGRRRRRDGRLTCAAGPSWSVPPSSSPAPGRRRWR